jgi:S1-C subfamily serine protease
MALRDIIGSFSQNTVRIEVAVGDKVGNGSGLILDNHGTILTCHHVVRPKGQVPGQIRVQKNGQPFNTEILRLEPYRDVALLRSEGLSGECRFKQFQEVEVGDECLVFGYPLNMSNLSVLRAMVSAKGNHLIQDFPYDCIQVDGRINRGNSGGPVVDIETGKVVGIVTAKYIPFLKSVEELQQFVRTNRMSTSGGSVQIMGVDFAAFFNAMFEMVDLLAEALQLIQVGIGYVIPLTVFSDYLR